MDVLVADDGGRVDATVYNETAESDELLWGNNSGSGSEVREEGADLRLSADVAVGREIFDDFESGVAAKNDNGEDWKVGYEIVEGGDVGGILTDGIIELMFFAAKIEDFGPFSAVGVAIDPATVIFGFKDVNAAGAECEAVDLSEAGRGEIIPCLGSRSRVGLISGCGIGLWEIAISKNIFWREKFFECENQAAFAGSELRRIRRGDMGAADGV